MKVHNGYGSVSGPVNHAHRVGDAGTIRDRPLRMVDEGPVYERGLLSDDRNPFVDKGGQPEVLSLHVARLVHDGPGVAGEEQSVVAWQRRAYIVEEVGSLGQRPLAIVEVGPAAKSGCAGDFL